MRTTAPDVGVVRDLPEFKSRRETPPQLVDGFANQLAARMDDGGNGPATRRAPARDRATRKDGAEALDPADLAAADFGPAPTKEQAELIRRAKGLLGIPYVWGGDSPKGLDCSAFLSRVWGVPRQTTDTLSKVAVNITKDELEPGDAMNLPTWKDSDGFGHVRMFERWGDAKHTKVWVYEATQGGIGKTVHRLIDYDPAYQPMRLKELAD
jgi:hypothetical protein